MTVKVCVDRGGAIQLRQQCPAGLLPLYEGNMVDVLERISMVATMGYEKATVESHGYGGFVWLVDDVRKGSTAYETMDALNTFKERLVKCKPAEPAH